MTRSMLHRLARVSPVVAFAGTLALLLAGLFLPGIVGGLLLFVLAAGLATLTFTTWPVQTGITRAVRLVLLAFLVAAAVAKTL